uniref:Uncharacterized protein n=1 Tax=Romanomermis culicivorax TaxID=13658 RepID=A0A915I5Q4_ROMCU
MGIHLSTNANGQRRVTQFNHKPGGIVRTVQTKSRNVNINRNAKEFSNFWSSGGPLVAPKKSSNPASKMYSSAAYHSSSSAVGKNRPKRGSISTLRKK